MILAQALSPRAEHFKRIQEQFARNDPYVSSRNIAIVLLLLVFAVVLMWLFTRLQRAGKRQATSHPLNLYRRILRRLDLPLKARWRLWRLARALNLEHPTALLICEKLYDEAVRKYGAMKKRASDRAAPDPAYQSIRIALFPT